LIGQLPVNNLKILENFVASVFLRILAILIIVLKNVRGFIRLHIGSSIDNQFMHHAK